MRLLRIEDVRVPSDHLVRDDVEDLFDAESLFISADLCIQHDLQQHVAEFLDDGRVVLRVNRLEQFVSLFEREWLDGFECLLPVPWTAGR